MKKFIGVLVTVALVLALVPVAQAAEAPAIISVTAPQIDNRVYEYGETVRVVLENAELTKTGVEVDIIETTTEEIRDVVVIDDITFEFNLKMYREDVGSYTLKAIIPKDVGAPYNVWGPNAIEVRDLDYEFDMNPISADEITDNGIVVRFTDPPEDLVGEFFMDDVKIDHTKINDRVFRLYPDPEVYADKNMVKVCFYLNSYGLDHEKELYILDDEFWMEPGTIARNAPLAFTLNSMNVEFPSDEEDISIIVRGRGRYFKITDISINDEHSVEVYSHLPLATGTYDMSITWPDLGLTYTIPLTITKSVIQSDMDLDAAVEDAVYEKIGGFDFTVDDEILDFYLNSSKKTIDFSDRELEDFYLLIENSAVNTLADAGMNLRIMFADCSITVPADALATGRAKDLYVVLEGGKPIDNLDISYYYPGTSVYMDTNLSWFKLMVPVPNNLYSFEGIEVVRDYIDTGREMLSATLESGMMSCEADATGTYQFALKGMSFDDLAMSHWAAKYVYPLTALEIINGMGDGTYQPGGFVTNAQFTKLVCETINLETGSTTSYFADVFKTDWYFPYLAAMEGAGIVSPGTYFNPDEPMNRLEMAKTVVRAYVYYTGADVEELAAMSDDTFMDIASLSIEDRNFIKAAYSLEIINGMSANTFSPDGTATRAHAATMIYRLLDALGVN